MASAVASNGWYAKSLEERERRLERMDGPILELAERMHEYVLDYAHIRVVSKLAVKYSFDYQEAIRFLNGEQTSLRQDEEGEGEAKVTEPVKVTKVTVVQVKPTKAPEQTKASKAAVPLPFDPTRVVVSEKGGCQGLRTNHGLYTQCQSEPAPNAAELGKYHIYCTVCLKQADKNSHGKPNAGTVADRLACKNPMAYAAPDGKCVLSYGKVCQLLSIDQDRAVAEANKLGLTIPDEQWVIKQSKSKSKSKKSPKTAAVTDSSSDSEADDSASSAKKQKKPRKYKTKKPDTDSELIAELVKQTSTDIPTLLVEVGTELTELCAATPSTVPTPPASSPPKKVKKEKKKKDPNAPKRAPSAYNLFIQDKTNRAKYPEASAKEIMTKLSGDWKSLSETDMEMWKNKAITRKAEMTLASASAPVVEMPLPIPAPTVVETPLPTPTPTVVETPLPTRIIEGFEHVKKDFPELELDEYIGTCVTEGEETDDEGDVVIETLIYNGVTYYKDSEGLVYDGDDTQVGVWDPATEGVEFLYG